MSFKMAAEVSQAVGEVVGGVACGGEGRGNLPEGVFHYCHHVIRNAALKNGDLKVRKSREPGQPRVRNSIWLRPLFINTEGKLCTVY